MTQEEKIREAMQRFNQKQALTMIGSVTAVDEANATCTVDLGNGLEIDDVRLKAAIDDSDAGVYALPAIGAIALILRILGSDEFQMIACSAASAHITKIGGTLLHIDADAVTFNQAAKNSFMTDINALTSKINALEGDLNSLKTVLATWVPVVSDGGAALKAAAATWASSSITPTTVNDLKDEKIKH